MATRADTTSKGVAFEFELSEIESEIAKIMKDQVEPLRRKVKDLKYRLRDEVLDEAIGKDGRAYLVRRDDYQVYVNPLIVYDTRGNMTEKTIDHDFISKVIETDYWVVRDLENDGQ